MIATVAALMLTALLAGWARSWRLARRAQRGQARLENLIRLSSDWFWEQDEELRFVAIAQSFGDDHWMRLPGYVGRRRWDAPYAGITEEERQEFEARLARREPFRDFEFMRPDPAGNLRWVSISGQPVFGPAGDFRGYRGTGRDIHERKLSDAAVRDSERRLAMALAAGGMVAWEWRGGDTPFAWGANAERILGPLASGRAAHPALRDLVHPDDGARFLEPAGVVGGEYRSEFRIVWPGGAVRWIKLQGEVQRDAQGAFERVVGLAQDITDRVAAGDALRESEARYRAVLETTSDAVLVIDGESRITYVNGAVQTIFGWSPDELAGRDLSVLQPERLRAAHRRGVELRARGEPVERRTAEVVGLARDGREFPVEVSFGEIELAGERFYVGFLRDISARRHAEVALHRINTNLERHVSERTAQLEAANRELESFSYTVAHDLRAPLRAIEGYSRLLEEAAGLGLDAESRRYLERMRTNAASMTGMIEELLELSRVGRLEIDPRPVDLELLARQCADQLASTYPEAVVEVAPMPPLEADPTLLRMVLANLVGNALKFSSRRRDACVRVSALEVGNEVVVSVADNGVGFDPRHAGKLFGVFQRLHTRSEFEGTGIGLATVARIVARHGGRAWADSVPGEGATFHFSIPRRAGGQGLEAA